MEDFLSFSFSALVLVISGFTPFNMYSLFSAFQMHKKQYEKFNLRILGYTFQMHLTQIHQLIKHKSDDLLKGTILQFPNIQE